MRPKISMREALAEPQLFGRIMQGESWYAWRVLLIAAAGEELTEDERQEFKRLTGRAREPGRLCRELIVAAGRRAGKTTATVMFAVWIAALCDHRGSLTVGEIGVVLIVSQSHHWSREILVRIEGVLMHSDPLAQMIGRNTADAIELSNNVRIEVRPASYRTLRGPTYLAVLCDELAFWYTDTDYANPDREVLSAIRPGLLTTSGPLLMVSSVYAKTGVLYESWQRYYGADGPPDMIVGYGTSRDFNPSLPQEEIDRALERDPVANAAEYLSQWRADVEGFIHREVVMNNVRDYIELPPQPNIVYKCFVDPASGVQGGDSYAICIAHKQGDRVVIDVIREQRPPFDAFVVIEQILVPLCKAYRIYTITGDNYAGEFAKLPVRRAGLGYELAEKHKSALYLDPFLSLLNSGKLDLPKHERAISQICSLERSTSRSGRDMITHPPHGHDDAANAIAGVVDLIYARSGYTLEPFRSDFRNLDLPPEPDPPPREPVQANGNWWKSMPRSNQKIPSGDDRLRAFYQQLDIMSRGGFLK